LKNAGLIEVIGTDRMFPSVEEAVRALSAPAANNAPPAAPTPAPEVAP
jgi:hypothetical protein